VQIKRFYSRLLNDITFDCLSGQQTFAVPVKMAFGGRPHKNMQVKVNQSQAKCEKVVELAGFYVQ